MNLYRHAPISVQIKYIAFCTLLEVGGRGFEVHGRFEPVYKLHINVFVMSQVEVENSVTMKPLFQFSHFFSRVCCALKRDVPVCFIFTNVAQFQTNVCVCE